MFVGKFARSLIENHRRQTTFKKMEAVIIARKKALRITHVMWGGREAGVGGHKNVCNISGGGGGYPFLRLI